MAIRSFTCAARHVLGDFGPPELVLDDAHLLDRVDFGDDEAFEAGPHRGLEVLDHPLRAGLVACARSARACGSSGSAFSRSATLSSEAAIWMRAFSFSAGATPSSMSIMIASTLSVSALSIMRWRSPGTNIQERRSLLLHRLSQ